jgi:hypothetical protein
MPQADNFPQPLHQASVIGGCYPTRCRVRVVLLGPTELIPVDAHGVRRLLDLPWLHSHSPAYVSQEKVQRLFKGVVTVLPGKKQELASPPDEVWLMLWHR